MRSLKILWAVDPLAEEIALQRSAAQAIQWLTKNRPNALVQPIFMANDLSAGLPGRAVRHYLEKVDVFANDSLHELLKKISIHGMRPLRIIARPFASADEAAQELIASQAEENGYDLIVASSRARRDAASELGLPGSFVEALIRQSSLPVFAVNPQWRRFLGYKRIVFPTDFSSESKEWLDYAIGLAGSLQMKLALFHKLSFPLGAPSHRVLSLVPEVGHALAAKIERAHWQAKKWVLAARKRGVQASVSVESRQQGSYLDSFSAALDKLPGMPLIAPPVSAQFSPAAIHALIRRTRSPVWYVPTTLRVGAVVKETAAQMKRAA
jgi:nucleotide-binding universal stress UspA family protein